MIKQMLQATVLKRLAARTPMGAVVVYGGGWYLKHRRSKRAQQAATAR
ncbi:DUF6203 family protein [Cryptosporangium aurantiacum]|uniref:Uncharacterized protein n=1 Tax=Cryptosporangium aurantiacum TaxID=134849 RepID=A0A1M7RQ81_9ACTN|nr:DUF6203 family protein [Cryptosporangium aurantiacum]SHN48256.1 hypothetical protein SAMN05443668_1413 [Cryptosporangium aurantiacum]